MHTANGTAMAMATSEVATVTHSRRAIPKCSGEESTSQSCESRKFESLSASAGIAWMTRKAPTRVTRATTRIPAP